MNKVFSYIILLLFFLGCKEDLVAPKSKPRKPEMSVYQDYPKPKKLSLFSAKKVENWQEYQDLILFFERFANTSSNQILINANELKNIVTSLKKSEKPIFLEKPSLNSRINVLENEALRLEDMTLISAIKNEEVSAEILKIIDLFSSLNEKINTMYSQKQFEEGVGFEAEEIQDTKEKPQEKNKAIRVKKQTLTTTKNKKRTLKEQLKLDKK